MNPINVLRHNFLLPIVKQSNNTTVIKKQADMFRKIKKVYENKS